MVLLCFVQLFFRMAVAPVKTNGVKTLCTKWLPLDSACEIAASVGHALTLTVETKKSLTGNHCRSSHIENRR